MKIYNNYQDAALLALRLMVAAIFLVAGIMKFGMWNMEPSEQMSAGMLSLIKFLAITETLGAVAVLAGFLTRWAAAGLGIIMLGAMYVIKFQMGVGFVSPTGAGWNFPLMILGGCLVLMAFGAGDWALDVLWGNKGKVVKKKK